MTIFLHILALFVLDILLIAVLSWVVIAIMERERCVSKERKKDKDSNYFCQLREVLKDDWHYEKVGRLIMFLGLMINLVGTCLIAYEIPLENYKYWNIFEKFINDHPLFTNIFGTFFGIVLIFVVLRPRLRIERQLLTINIDKVDHLKVRIKNVGIFPVNNVNVQLLFYRDTIDQEGKDVKKTKMIKLMRADTPLLRGIIPSNEDSSYGCGTELTITELKKERFLKDSKIQYEGIICRVTATHAISGVTYVREHDFKKTEVDEFFNRS